LTVIAKNRYSVAIFRNNDLHRAFLILDKLITSRHIMAEEKEDSGFKVQDRRRLSPEAEESSKKETPSKEKEGTQPTSEAQTQEQKPEPGISDGPVPEVTFSSLILSLTTQALLCFGEIPNPQDGKPHQDLPTAQHIIDILGVLKTKTEGNLEQSEKQLLEHSLFDLRMKYVEIAKGK
jgi:hypothetical protein